MIKIYRGVNEHDDFFPDHPVKMCSWRFYISIEFKNRDLSTYHLYQQIFDTLHDVVSIAVLIMPQQLFCSYNDQDILGYNQNHIMLKEEQQHYSNQTWSLMVNLRLKPNFRYNNCIKIYLNFKCVLMWSINP